MPPSVPDADFLSFPDPPASVSAAGARHGRKLARLELGPGSVTQSARHGWLSPLRSLIWVFESCQSTPGVVLPRLPSTRQWYSTYSVAYHALS